DGVTPLGSPYLVMDFVSGETLDAAWQRRGKRLPTDEALEHGEKLLEVLAAAHEGGVLHLDLKPENTLLTSFGGRKGSDFSVATEIATEIAEEMSPPAERDVVAGTPEFMAPEQARVTGAAPCARADVFAVGAILYTLLSGRYVRSLEGALVPDKLAV